jgi:leader peptidase (prepilin peptidase) / N-methyltransferase
MLPAYVFIPMLLVMVIAVYTDLRSRMIYDWMTLPGIGYFLLAHAFVQPDNWFSYALGVIVLGGVSLIMAVISKGQLGGGDIKLFALVGAALGWQAGLVVMGFTYLIAGIGVIPVWIVSKVMKKQAKREVPLAPYIAGGTALLLGLAFYMQGIQ